MGHNEPSGASFSAVLNFWPLLVTFYVLNDSKSYIYWFEPTNTNKQFLLVVSTHLVEAMISVSPHDKSSYKSSLTQLLFCPDTDYLSYFVVIFIYKSPSTPYIYTNSFSALSLVPTKPLHKWYPTKHKTSLQRANKASIALSLGQIWVSRYCMTYCSCYDNYLLLAKWVCSLRPSLWLATETPN